LTEESKKKKETKKRKYKMEQASVQLAAGDANALDFGCDGGCQLVQDLSTNKRN
jgi:hypothetical protein